MLATYSRGLTLIELSIVLIIIGLIVGGVLVGQNLIAAAEVRATGKYEHRLITGGVGHNLPQEAPGAFAKAVIDVDGFCSGSVCAGEEFSATQVCLYQGDQQWR